MRPPPSAAAPAAPRAAAARPPRPGSGRAWRCRCSSAAAFAQLVRLALDRDAARGLALLHERYLDPQDAVLVGGGSAVGLHVGAELDHPAERPVRDLDLLVEPAARLLRTPLAGDDELAALDLERHLVDVHAGKLGLDDRARRLAAVVHVYLGREGATGTEAAALEDVAEQLVDLTPHAFEVGEQISFRWHGFR